MTVRIKRKDEEMFKAFFSTMRRGGAVNPAEEEQKQSDRCMQSSGARE